MADPHASPISQLLQSMGMTREDLNQRSLQMRQFLTANDSLPARVADLSSAGYRSRSSSDLRPGTRSSSSSFSMSRSLSRASSNSMRETSPPTTPVKSEHSESGHLLHRPMDNMEMVIERQRQSRKERKSKRERGRVSSKSFTAPASPSPSSTSQSAVSLDSFMYSRDEPAPPAESSGSGRASASTETMDAAPVTPQKIKYYRDHTMDSANSQPRKDTTCKTETPTPTRTLSQQMLPLPPFYAYPPYMAYPHYVPVSSAANDSATLPPPVTPHKSQPPPAATPTPTQKSIARLAMPSPLPPSSPLPASSSPPPSSPVPRVLHQVSSPGPMEPLPPEDQYDTLPYKLPPGPYSHTKPDLSYAALVGQAILSSLEHRLTLQEIYDWITIVYPHYKRGETTWMNSIRHVLSTTACFRKVPRDRSIGRTLWAIFDEDLECFKGGGFRKHLCKDIMLQQKEKAKKANARKRPEIEDSAHESRKSKKARKDSHYVSSSMHPAPPQMSAPVPVMGPQQSYIQPYFPRPTHQPYYETCLSQPQHQVLPAEIIFPPLPPDAALRAARVIHPRAPPPPASSTSEESPPLSPPPIMEKTASETSGSSSAISSIPSVPELTPNRSSSTTPPSSAPATSDMDIEFPDDIRAENRKDVVKPKSNVVIAGVDNDADADTGVTSSRYNEDDSVFNSSLLGPVQFWGESPRTASLLAPSIELINFDAMADDEDDFEVVQDTKGKGKSVNRKGLYPAAPASPTQSRSSGANLTELQPLALRAATDRPKTPVKSTASTSAVPATPPQRVRLDSSRTPISHKGLTMSPSASLAHYKNNLDPPPVIFQLGANKFLSSLALESDSLESDVMRTPRKANGSSSSAAVAGSSGSALLGPPVTPKKGLFESPFRTGLSPFRTPHSRDIYDPHDPRVLLDEELSRPRLGDSPVGIFGKRSSLLYDSPGVDPWSSSPGKKWSYW